MEEKKELRLRRNLRAALEGSIDELLANPKESQERIADGLAS